MRRPHRRSTRCWRRRSTPADGDALARLYEDDATLIVPPDGARVSGRDAIRTTVEPKLALASSFRSEVVELLEAGDLALTETRWSLGTELSGRG